jgi:hypothetical protein
VAVWPDMVPAPLPPPPSQLAQHEGPPGDAPPPKVKRTTEGKGVRSPFAPPASDEPIEISADEVESVDDFSDDQLTERADSQFDPWLAQLLFGYCPPEALPFERPPPPTAMPGKDPA